MPARYGWLLFLLIEHCHHLARERLHEQKRPKVATLANGNVMRSREIVASNDKSFRPSSASYSY